MINACICTIGDEILIGQIVDSNSAYIAKELDKVGIRTDKIISLGDRFDEIISEIEDLIGKYSIIITTGGLGPTKDDITKKALMRLSSSNKMIYDTSQSLQIADIFSKRGLDLSQTNKDQALIPDKCSVIPNKLGTAPCTYFSKNNSLIFSLPGVPFEMRALLPEVITVIRERNHINSNVHKTIATYGIAESTLSDRLERWETNLPAGIRLAYLPDPARGIRLRLSSYNGDKDKLSQVIDKQTRELYLLLTKKIIYGEDDDSLETVVIDLLQTREASISTAESCTGGNISGLLTSVPGSSKVYKGGIIAYSNEIKENILNVKKETLKEYGAVSKECAIEMASNVRTIMNTDFSLSVTGIAGPSGGTVEKPVGTVWIGIAGPDFCDAFLFRLSGDRIRNTIRSTANALNLIRLKLIGEI
jgi:nicotinamide-nucleotide amidase